MGEVVPIQPFVSLFADAPWRDNRDVMAYPFLSLQKRRTRSIEYADGKEVFLQVCSPVEYGLATIWDWDVVIYAASQLNAAVEADLEVSPILEFPPYDLLRQVGRTTGGKDYRELADAIRRLRLTTIITTIRIDDGAGLEEPFSWLIHYWLPKRYSRRMITPDRPGGEPDPAQPWRIELPRWLFACILRQAEILAVHPEYFRLTGGLERWLYRLARKAVPDKADPPAFTFRMETLHERSGVVGPLKRFALRIRYIAARQPLPEYGIAIERDGRGERVTLYRDPAKSARPRRRTKSR